MDEFETLAGFLEHVSPGHGYRPGNDGERVSIMTLACRQRPGVRHRVSCPGWEEGLFPHQRSLDESGLEASRRSGVSPMSALRGEKAGENFVRAEPPQPRSLPIGDSRRASSMSCPRRTSTFWRARSPFGGAYANPGALYGSPYGKSRFDEDKMQFRSSYDTPGWQRAQKQHSQNREQSFGSRSGAPRSPVTIEGQLVASSTAPPAGYEPGSRIMHQKFGPGTVTSVDGNKLTIRFDHAGVKRVVDSFVTPR